MPTSTNNETGPHIRSRLQYYDLPACNPGWPAVSGCRRCCIPITAPHWPAIRPAPQLDAGALHNSHPLDRAQYVWIKTMLERQILTWGGDHVDMARRKAA